MPEHLSPLRVHVAAATLGTHADSGAAVPAAGAVKVNPLLNPLLIGALGSGKSTSFVVGGEDR